MCGRQDLGHAKCRHRGLRSMRPADYGGATSQQPEVTQKRGSCSTSPSGADVLAPRSCCNRFLQTRWLKTSAMDSRYLEARGPKSRCQQARAPSARSGGESFHASSCSWWPQELLDLWQRSSNPLFHFHLAFSPACARLKSPCLFWSCTAFRAQDDFISRFLA